MKKSIYILGSVEIVIGSVLLCISSIIKETLPILGRIAYQAAAAGSYNPNDYTVSFLFANVIAVLLMIAGIVQIVYQYKKSDIQ
ncbi:MAG: hypothetical protein RSG53_10295 [Oscillospiraceae bacterium]